ncbi:MAG: hypothetical protein MJZ71_03390 [Bacteroidales bacterium]|nr:hypothetical protein [Bacteroidales bacterium]
MLQIVRQVLSQLVDDIDTGFAYSDLCRRKSLMVINRTSTETEFDNSLNHERQHLLSILRKSLE